MSNQVLSQMESLIKAMSAGSYNAAPSALVQGSALQTEDLSAVMENVCFGDDKLKLQKMISSKSCKSTTFQFNRQISYGHFGGSAQLEGNVGPEKTSDFVRVVVPMSYYSHLRRVTLASTLVTSVDGTASDDRAAQDAAINISADVEFDCFLGRSQFSNNGVFDGAPAAIPDTMANMFGIDVQIRQADTQRIARDINFDEFGGSESAIVSGGGALSQDLIEEATLRSVLHMGTADKGITSPRVLANYNKIAHGKERIILAGSPQGATGADLRKQWTSNGTAALESSIFLEGKTRPAEAVQNGPAAPSIAAAAGAISGATTGFTAGQVFTYYVTSCSEIGESVRSNAPTATIGTNGHGVTLTITPSGAPRWFNVYRSAAGGSAASAKFIGRVKNSGGATTSFIDIGNRLPGAADLYLLQDDTFEIRELAPYSRLKLAVADLSMPEAHYRFLCLAGFQPRKSTIVQNLV